MTTLVDRYIVLHHEQLLERVRAGGRLSEEREDAFIELFDALWRAMAEHEHQAVEAFLATEITPSAEVLVDIEDHGNAPRTRGAADEGPPGTHGPAD